MNNKSWLKILFFALFIHPSKPLINFSSQESAIELSQTGSTFNNTDATLALTNGQMIFKTNPTTQLSGSAISFSNAAILTSAGQIVGQYTASSSSIEMTGNQILYIGGGALTLPTINVSGSNNQIYGLGIISGNITLANASATLILNTPTGISATITLNSGTLQLGTNTIMTSGQIVGPGTVNLNNKTLFIGPNTNSTALTFSTGGRVVFLPGEHFLSATWTFGSTGSFRLVGQDANLTLNTGGAITFTTTSICGLDYLNIFGLTNTGSRKINPAASQTIELYGAKLYFIGAYTQTAGTISIKDNKCVFGTNTFAYTVSGATTVLLVDRKVLFFDLLGTSQTSPIVTASGGTISLLNGGVIRPVSRTDGTSGATGTAGGNGTGALGNLSITAATTTLTRHNRIDKYRTVTFNNTVPATPRTFTLNGNGHKNLFVGSTDPNLILTQNSQVTFTNTLLENFNPAGVLFGLSSFIVFGSGCFVDLAGDMVLDSSSPIWYAKTNPIICARKKNLTTIELRADGKINVQSATTLTLKNLVIKIRTPNPFSITSDSTIIFENCTLWHDQDFYFATGNVNWSLGNTLNSEKSFDSPAYMNLTGTGTMTVLADSSLEVGSGSGIKYAPDISSDLNQFYRMRHLILTAYSSVLTLNGATLFSTGTGLALDNGHLFIKNKSSFVSQGTGSFALTIADPVVIDITSGASLTLTGSLNVT